MRTIRSAYSDPVKVALVFPEQGRTKQSFKAECDINNIMAKYQRTGLVEFVNKHEPQYGDVTGFDFQASMNQVIAAQAMFEALPSSVRKRFHNDPAEFVAFMDDESQLEESYRLGLREKPQEVPKPEPVPEPAPAG